MMIVTKCLCADPVISRMIAEHPMVDFMADSRVQNLASYCEMAHENLKKPQFVFDEWTADNEMLSQTLKPKRRNLLKRYADIITETYNA